MLGKDGWTFRAEDGATGDRLYGLPFLRDLYVKADPHYSGRVTVPVLWDREQRDHRLQRIGRDHPDAEQRLRCLGRRHPRFLPGSAARRASTALNARVYATVNNGVYRAGFATSQAAYAEAFEALFATLDELEDAARRPALSCRRAHHRGRLAAVHDAAALRPGLCRAFQVQPAGASPTTRTCPTICAISIRFPGWPRPSTSNTSRSTITAATGTINPTGIVPLGPELDYAAPHDRDRLRKAA